MMRLLLILIIVTTFLGGCRPADSRPTPAPLGPKLLSETLRLGSQPLLNNQKRPSAILGFFVTHHLAQRAVPLKDSPHIGILQQHILLQQQPIPQKGAQGSLEHLSGLMHTNIPDFLNRSVDRANALNTYIDDLQKALGEARIQEDLLNTFLDEIEKTFSQKRKDVSREQKLQNKAMKDHRFAEAGYMQDRLFSLHQELAEIETRKNGAEDMQEILSEMIEISQKRLAAVQENREILIVGLSVKELPGMADLGILTTKKKRGLFR